MHKIDISVNKWIVIITITISVVIFVTLLLINQHKVVSDEPKKETFDYSQDLLPGKYKVILEKEQFDRILKSEETTVYYFPEDCPSYKEDFLIHTNQDKYFLPEKNHLIVVNKDHEWTKTPDNLVYWSQ